MSAAPEDATDTKCAPEAPEGETRAARPATRTRLACPGEQSATTNVRRELHDPGRQMERRPAGKPEPCSCALQTTELRGTHKAKRWGKTKNDRPLGTCDPKGSCRGDDAAPSSNDALSGRGPTEQQETRWSVPAVRLNA
jgi:hypothetical protein